jgi:hypothetical protein
MKRTPLSRGTKQLKRSGFKRPVQGSKLRSKALKPRKVTTSRKTEKSTAKLKKELDSVFSQFVRLKHANKDGTVACYTCGKVKNWREMQNGHFISRQYLVTRWNEDNCRVQCVGCNMFGDGKPLDFEENLKKELGDEHIELMKKSRHAILKLDRTFYETEIAFYKKRITEL